MKILEEIDRYLNESFSDKAIKILKKIANMEQSDEKDEMASKLMDDIDKQRANLNNSLEKGMDTKQHATIYNSNIKKSKEIKNLISDIVDSNNPSALLKKSEKMIRNLFK